MTPITTTTDQQLEQDSRALFAAVRKLLRTYQFRDRQRTCYYDISVTQCYALEALAQRGAMGVNDLSSELRLEKSSASRMLDSLEDKGYVRRKADPRDGRARLVEMTEKGWRVHDQIVEELVNEKREILTGVSKSARAAAIRIVAELARVADDRFGETNGDCGVEQPTPQQS